MSQRPLHAVLDAVSGGAASTAAVAQATGLDPVVVRSAIEQLERLGRVSVETLAFGCPGGGCGSCVRRGPEGSGCGAAAPSGRAEQGPGLTLVSARER